MDSVLQGLGAGFLVTLGTLIVGWGVFVTAKIIDLEERLDKQNEINKLFKLKKRYKEENKNEQFS